MSERKLEMLRLRKMVGKVSPKELGRLYREFFKKYMREEEKASFNKEVVEIFNGRLI